MGQYYQPILIKEENGEDVKTISTWDYECGMKLMEHSYIGNAVCNVVMNELVDNPQRLFWMGDYAEYEDLEVNKDSIVEDEKKFKELYLDAWGDGKEHLEFKNGNASDCNYRFIVNHTKQQYIDLLKYRKQWGHWKQWINRNTGECEIYNECVNPLPLLTSVGNGKGGGDYWKEYPNSFLCGDWAGDLIEISNKLPDGYLEFEEGFEEVYDE